MRKTKFALMQSMIALLLCFSMLIGTTFAWFTDEVISGSNIIQAGNLDAEMYWTDDLSTGTWYNAEKAGENTPFDYVLWEPGYTEVRYVKIVNAGKLALKYNLTLAPAGEVGKLAEVIDVYYAENVTANIADRTLSGMTKLGALLKAMNGAETAKGELLPGGETIVAVALHMDELAGNEYQGKSIGDGFVFKLLATQLAKEPDSFGPDYDENATFPVLKPGSITADISSKVQGNMLTEAVTMVSEDGAIAATVPAGTKVSGNSLILSVSELSATGSNITLQENEILRPMDVHIEGVAADNDAPILVTVKEAMMKGLNIGNYQLYHVEQSGVNAMTAGALDQHNGFTYDPATGNVTVALATFSEVAIVAEEAKWEGNFDYSWYDASKTELTIANADQLAAFGAIVGGMNGKTVDSFKDKTVKLISDINLGDEETENNPAIIFYPIGYYNSEGTYERTNTAITSGLRIFEGTFDGNGHTVSNFYHNTWEMKGDHNWYSPEEQYYRDGMGLFGRVYKGTVKNLTVKNFSSDGEIATTGVIAAYADGATFENIAIFNCNPRVYNIGNGGIVGCVGWYAKEANLKTTFKNITVDNSNKISALWGSYDVACGGIVGQYYPTSGQSSAEYPVNAGIDFVNCHVSAQMDVYNDVCANYQYYAYRYTGMLIGSVRENETIDGKSYPKMDGITASGCTVHFGTWNDYYYCEIIDNTTASYTHDYQMSRLTEIKAIDGTTITYLDGTTGAVPASGRANYVIVDYTKGHGTENATCYHFKDGAVWTHDMGGIQTGIDENGDGQDDLKEDKQHIYLEFNNLVTGYGWGVTTKGVGDLAGVTILDRQEGNSVVKFETKFTGDFLYRVGNGNPVSLGSLFKVRDELPEALKNIASSGVWVTIEKLDDNMNVAGTYTKSTTDKWEEAKIQFNGTGVVKVTIQDYAFCVPTELYLEVVDAHNRTTASFGGNSVLLNDVSTSSTLSTSGVIYGNGFTVNMENAPISEKNGAVFHLYDGAIIKNLGIVGKEFTSVAMNVNDTNYGVSAVRAWGTVVIENCYISGCRAAVSVTGTELTIKDSVIANGVYANVDFRSGILNLHNVTTINEPHAVNGTTIVGLGIVGNMTASAGRQLNITGTLTQYNWLSKVDCENIKATGVSNILNSVFSDSKYANLRYTYNGTTYVNAGILSLCSDFGAPAVTGVPDTYAGMDVTGTIGTDTVNGYVWAPGKAGILTAADMNYHDAVYDWTSADQGTSYIPPVFQYENAGVTAENGVVQIEYENGTSYTMPVDVIKKLISATKYGKDLSYKVTMNGTDYTGEDIVFDATASQNYTITYTVTDNLVYNKNGNLSNKIYEVTKELKVFATVVDKGADAPTFTFYYGTNGSASAGNPHVTQPGNSYTSKIEQIGGTYYIMPNVNATSANAIGSESIDGKTVFYPIVDGINYRSGRSSDYDFTRYYPVFKAVSILDNGTEYSYESTKEMPDTVQWVSAEIDSGNGASSLNDGFGLYNNQYLCKIQKKAGDAEAGGTSVVKFSYKATDGNTYHYYVGFRFYNEDEGGCITQGTLITMADGTQKPVEDLNIGDMVLAFNHVTGQFEATPLIFNTHVDDLEPKEYDVLHLQFSNGQELEIVESHGLFDMTLMKYVYLDYENYNEFVGHQFFYAGSDGTSSEYITLENAYIETEVTRIFCPVTYFNMNSIANGFLNAPNSPYGIAGPVNYFDYDPDLKYNEEKMQADIEKYGLYTYDDFKDYISEEAYNSSTAVFLKVAEGKGLITFEEILIVIEYLLAGSLIN